MDLRKRRSAALAVAAIGLALTAALLVVSMDVLRAQSQDEEPATEPAADGDAGAPSPLLTTGPPPGEGPIREAWLAARLDAIVAAHPELIGARIGAVVADPGTELILYLRDADGRYNLASGTKIVTTAAALALLGPDFTFRTTLLAEEVDAAGVVAGDLHVRGRADPSLGTAELRALCRELRQRGVTAIRGGLVLDLSYFDGVEEPPHFAEQPKSRAAYRAPIGALSLDFNAVTVTVIPDRAGGAAAVSLDPPGDHVSLATASVATVATGRSKVGVDVKKLKEGLAVRVTGQIRFDAGVATYRVRIDDPAAFFASALRALLAEQGITVGKKSVKRGPAPATARPLVSRTSDPLSLLVRGMGKFSNNFVAESLLKTIGAEVKLQRLIPTLPPPPPPPPPKPGVLPPPPPAPPAILASWEDGLAAVRGYLVDRIGLPAAGFRYENGSGLFGSSDFTPAQIVAVLAAAQRDYRVGPDLVASLSIAGRDGTLRKRMSGTAAERRVRAKTGTLAAVATLSGFAAVDGRRPLCFSILLNEVPEGKGEEARALIDQMAASIAEFLDVAPR